MIYSSRLKKILAICLRNDDQNISYDTLASTLKTSRRTIFRELHDVDEQLAPYGVRLVTQQGKGIHVEGDEQHRIALLEELNASQIQYVDKEERQNMLIFELLRSDDLQKLIHYANIFQVSEATISNDIEHIAKWFVQYHIIIVRKPGIGVQLCGNETDKRKAMTAIVQDTLHHNTHMQVNYLNSQKLLEQIFMNEKKNSIMRLLNQDIVKRILHIFEQYQHELQFDRYAQSSYIGMIIHLAIAIDRIQKQEPLLESDSVFEMVKDESSYQTAKLLSTRLEIEFDIEIPEIETAFIALHMKGAKMNDAFDEQVGIHTHEFAGYIHQMLTYYDEDVHLRLQQDERLFQGLITHLEPAITRLKHHLRIYNPLLTSLKQQYGILFQQTKRACSVLERAFQCVISDDEVGFITMHIGAALERNEQPVIHRVMTIGVVCASGMGVSALLSARIAKYFQDRRVTIQTLSMDQLQQQLYQACDILISTFVLEDVMLPHVQVNPLLNQDDVENIERLLNQAHAHPQHTTAIDHDFYQELVQMQEASTACLQILNHICTLELKDMSTIQDLIIEASLLFGEDEQKRVAIQKSLMQREELGSIIMHDYGFAMLHAKSTGIDHCAFGILYPTSTYFSEEELQDIRFVVVLLIPQGASHIATNIMAQCSRGLLEDDAYRNALQNRDQQDIIIHIMNLLRMYLAECE